MPYKQRSVAQTKENKYAKGSAEIQTSTQEASLQISLET